ncbi:MAG: hypothetical protein IPM56_10355 [Ignavibacteriales bacterium]|nr:MAG: hypothetical protein IPM56_10355 [Ignavibacteriales bacterium]
MFLKDNIASEQVASLQDSLQQISSVKKVKYISKEKAAEIFIQQTGDDFRKILDYNPLPASFSISIGEEALSNDSLNTLLTRLKKIDSVDEVVYQQEFISELIKYLDSFKKYLLLATAVLILISLYVVYSTIKLIISSKYSELETMKLVGAKLSTIKLPIIFNGLIVGLIAGILSAAFYFLVTRYAGGLISLEKYFDMNNVFYLAVAIGSGPLLNLLVSVIALRKISLKI